VVNAIAKRILPSELGGKVYPKTAQIDLCKITAPSSADCCSKGFFRANCAGVSPAMSAQQEQFFLKDAASQAISFKLTTGSAGVPPAMSAAGASKISCKNQDLAYAPLNKA
jgi:hypothetical protein